MKIVRTVLVALRSALIAALLPACVVPAGAEQEAPTVEACDPATTDPFDPCAATTDEEVVERAGALRAVLSGVVDVPLLSNRLIDGIDFECRGRLFAEDGRIGLELLSKTRQGVEVPFAEPLPTMNPVAPDASGAFAGRMIVPIDFAGEHEDLAGEDNVRAAEAVLRFRLRGGTDLSTCSAVDGSVTLLAQGVATSIGVDVDLNLSGVAVMELAPALQ